MSESVLHPNFRRFQSASGLVLAALFTLLTVAPAHGVAALSCDDVFSGAAFRLRFEVQPRGGRVQIDRDELLAVDDTGHDQQKYIANVLETLPKEDLAELLRLKELSIETGRALGLPAREVQALIAKWIDDGTVGGARHIYALISIDSSLGKEMRYSNSNVARGYHRNLTTKIFTKATYRELRSRLNSKERVSAISKMPQSAGVYDKREGVILGIWYAATIDRMIDVATERAPTDAEVFVKSLPFYISRASTWGSVIAVPSAAAGALLIGGDTLSFAAPAVAAGFVGVRTSLSLLKRTKLGQWILDVSSEQPLRFKKKRVEDIKDASRLLVASKFTRLQPPESKFNVMGAFSPVSQALRAEISRVEFRNDLFIDLDVKINGSNLAVVVDTMEPLINLLDTTARLQYERLVDMKKDFDSMDEAQRNLKFDRFLSHFESMNIDIGVSRVALHAFKQTIRKGLALNEQAIDPAAYSQLQQLEGELEGETAKLFISIDRELSSLAQSLRQANPGTDSLSPINFIDTNSKTGN